MSTKAHLKARLDFVRRELDGVLDHVQDDFLGWAPLEGMRTVGGQIVEIGGTEIQTLARLKGLDDVSWEEAQVRMGDASSLAHLRRRLAEVRAETLELLDSLSEDDLAAPTGKFKGWHESIGLAEVPVAEIFRGTAQHEYYHIGQLVSYLWARGDNPYKW